jgi:hypothetical protein
MQRDEQIRWLMLEQMVSDTYEDASFIKNTNQYGLLTDIWIHFRDPDDATHFKLRFG